MRKLFCILSVFFYVTCYCFSCYAQKSKKSISDLLLQKVNSLERESDSLMKIGEYQKAYQCNKEAISCTARAFKYIYAQQERNMNLQINLEKEKRDKERLQWLNDSLQLRKRIAEEKNHQTILEKRSAKRKINIEMSKQKYDQAQRLAWIEKERNQYAFKQYIKEKQINNILNHIEWISILVFVLLIGSLLFYVYNRRVYVRQLMIRKQAAEEARQLDLKAHEEAEKAREEAEKANVMKTAFIQNMSHEIRTPLNAIVGFSGILTDPTMKLDKVGKQEFSTLISKNSDLLITLINDILDLSNLTSGQYKMKYKKTTICEMCNTAYNTVKYRTPDGVAMSFDIPVKGENITLWTDSARVEQVLVNYFTNACKYTTKGSIRLTYSIIYEEKCRVPAFVRFSVTDTGIGVPLEKAEAIFKRFEKLDDFKQGNGLGLNICRTIAERLNARCWLDTTYTDGARFYFEIPVHLEDPSVEEI